MDGVGVSRESVWTLDGVVVWEGCLGLYGIVM